MEEKSFEEYLQEEDFNELKKGKVFEGNIASISGDGVWVALPATGDVFVKREELIKNISEYKPGESITVTVTKTNDAEGMNDASEKMAVADKIREELKEEQIVKAKFVTRVKKK
ncbi:MAG: S1 RNA-binding domain-containing protein [Thermotogae bacterium]|nr:S1 RNA-binding domain-containing protein [Thermotogota bacterium]